MASTDVVNPLRPWQQLQNGTDRLADPASSPSASVVRTYNDAASQRPEWDPELATISNFPRLRETEQLRYALGFPMLLPVGSPRFLLYFDGEGRQLVRFDLTAAGAPDGGPEGTVVLTKLGSATAAVSADGGSMCVNQRSHLLVFDTAQLLAARAVLDDPATSVQPRARTAQPTHQDGTVSICGAAFSDDGGLLYAMCAKAAAITVHDALHSDLPRLRTLPFMAGDNFGSNYILTSGGGLLAAAGGGYNSARADLNARTVRVWRLSDKEADEETVLHTLELESAADAVAIRPDGEQFAVGLRDGTIKVFLAALAAGAQARLLVELDAPATSSDGAASGAAVHSLCFGPDGAALAAGRADGTFMVYDMAATAATVNVFTQPKSAGTSLAFAERDFLVTGGGTPGTFVVRSLRPPPALCTIRPEFVANDGTDLSLPASINNADMIAGADRGATLISVASGPHLEVSAIDGEVLLARDLGAEMSLYLNFHSAVRLRPGGGHIACGLSSGKEVVVLSIADGAEAARISPEHQGRQMPVLEMRWSSDGSLLLLASYGGGVTVFAAERKFAEVQRLIGPHESIYFFAVNFNQSSSHLVTCSLPSSVTVWDVATWAQLHVFDPQVHCYAVCLSPTADRVAYATADGTVVVRAVDASGDDDEVHLQFSNVNGWADLSFSPDGDFLLVCPSDGGEFDRHKMRVLDL
eukprot:SAG31_NODE_1871_length_7025_cov_10.081144_1_plen_696_part_10